MASRELAGLVEYGGFVLHSAIPLRRGFLSSVYTIASCTALVVSWLRNRLSEWLGSLQQLLCFDVRSEAFEA